LEEIPPYLVIFYIFRK